jgi:hypothetical protein
MGLLIPIVVMITRVMMFAEIVMLAKLMRVTVAGISVILVVVGIGIVMITAVIHCTTRRHQPDKQNYPP